MVSAWGMVRRSPWSCSLSCWFSSRISFGQCGERKKDDEPNKEIQGLRREFSWQDDRETFTVTRFVLYSSRDSVGGGPYVIEAAYDLEDDEGDYYGGYEFDQPPLFGIEP